MSSKEEIQKMARGKWYHSIYLGDGITTKGNPGNNRFKWKLIRNHLPKDMSKEVLLDLGCAEGYFSLRCMMRGCNKVVMVERSPNMQKKIKFVMDCYNFNKNYSLVTNEIEDILRVNEFLYGIDTIQKFDYVFALAIYHWLHNPLKFLEYLGQVTTKKCFFEIRTNPKDECGLHSERKDCIKWDFGSTLFERYSKCVGFKVVKLIDNYITSFGSNRSTYVLSKI